MDLLVVVVLILFGLLFCVVELLILPGVTLGGVLSVVCSGSAIYLAFRDMGTLGGITVVVIILVLTCLAVAFSLRAKTWDRFSLSSKIDSASSDLPESELSIGDKGVTTSRLSPMGKISVAGRTFEAKSEGSYIDAHQEVEVVGFENFSVIVKKI